MDGGKARPGAIPESAAAATKERALFLRRLNQERELSLRTISRMTGVPYSTLCLWRRTDMSAHAKRQRKERSTHRKLSLHNEQILAGLVFYRSVRGLDTSTATVKAAAQHMFGGDFSPSWLTRWKTRHHLSLQKIHRLTHAAIDDSAFEEGVALIKKIRRLRLRPEQLYAIDKKMIKDAPHSPLQIGPTGMYRSRYCAFCP